MNFKVQVAKDKSKKLVEVPCENIPGAYRLKYEKSEPCMMRDVRATTGLSNCKTETVTHSKCHDMDERWCDVEIPKSNHVQAANDKNLTEGSCKDDFWLKYKNSDIDETKGASVTDGLSNSDSQRVELSKHHHVGDVWGDTRIRKLSHIQAANDKERTEDSCKDDFWLKYKNLDVGESKIPCLTDVFSNSDSQTVELSKHHHMGDTIIQKSNHIQAANDKERTENSFKDDFWLKYKIPDTGETKGACVTDRFSKSDSQAVELSKHHHIDNRWRSMGISNSNIQIPEDKKPTDVACEENAFNLKYRNSDSSTRKSVQVTEGFNNNDFQAIELTKHCDTNNRWCDVRTAKSTCIEVAEGKNLTESSCEDAFWLKYRNSNTSGTKGACVTDGFSKSDSQALELSKHQEIDNGRCDVRRAKSTHIQFDKDKNPTAASCEDAFWLKYSNSDSVKTKGVCITDESSKHDSETIEISKHQGSGDRWCSMEIQKSNHIQVAKDKELTKVSRKEEAFELECRNSDTNRMKSVSYIKVAKYGEEVVEIPCEEDGNLLMTTLTAQFPGANGLKYRNSDTCTMRKVLITDGKFIPPYGTGWGSSLYLCCFPKVAPNNRNSCPPSRNSCENVVKMETERKCSDLIVEGLKISTTEEVLRQYFESFGEVIVAQINRDPESGRSKGYGFVRFSSYESQARVLSRQNRIDGKGVYVRITNTKVEKAAEMRRIRNEIRVKRKNQKTKIKQKLRREMPDYSMMSRKMKKKLLWDKLNAYRNQEMG